MSSTRRPSLAPTLTVLKGEKTVTVFEVKHDLTLIGRSPLCHVVLDRKSVSRRHAQIVREGDDYFLENLSRKCPTKVNSEPVDGRVRLRDGCLIEISRHLLAFNNPAFRIEEDGNSSARILSSFNVSSSSQGRGPAVTAQEKLDLFLEISRNLGDTLHLDVVLKKTLDALFDIFPQAERGFVVLKEGRVMDDVPRAFKFRGDQEGDLTISRTIFDHVMDKGEATLSTDLPNDSRFKDSQSVVKSQIRTMMCIPLLAQDRNPAGILQIDTRKDTDRFNQNDLDLLAAVGVLVGVAIDNARMHARVVSQTLLDQETADAREVVRTVLLPAQSPEIPGYQFWDYYKPAQFVGGDYFDYLPVSSTEDHANRWAIVVADVSGKGMSAALLMARLSAEVRLLILSGVEPITVVARLNDNFARAGVERRFITFLLVLIDGDTHQMTVVNAGHMGPIIHRASGAIEEISETSTGLPLGVTEGLEYRADRTTLGPGDRVVLYTDGINEALNTSGRCLGAPRLKQVIFAAPGSIDGLGGAILGAVSQHVAKHPQSDDITLLCFGRT